MRDNVLLLVTNCLVIVHFTGIGLAAMAGDVGLCRVLALMGVSAVAMGTIIRNSPKPQAGSGE